MSSLITVVGLTSKGKEHNITVARTNEFKVKGADFGLTVFASGFIGAFDRIVSIEFPEGKPVTSTNHEDGEWAGMTFIATMLNPGETAVATPVAEGKKFRNKYTKLIVTKK